ncbi:hypothetical protein U9M48_026166 [Paspalum notatum var. saurae]|uniref:Peptidase A1 domain-containing protein n=1 Tax=Paspalum notatum var. saurae TaxID=547442 RepID=A0AAQ3WYI3_PASNO
MARFNHRGQCHLLLAVAAVVALTFLAAAEASSSLGFDLHHRFSPVVRKWAEARGHKAAEWPAKGTPEYFSALSRHDRARLARRGLAGRADGLLTFADGNETFLSPSLGFLHYAEVAVGTPNTTFLVALDTGSDLFWVPCDCKQCANISDVSAQGTPPLRPYSPRQSSTSKQVGCDNALCDRPNACSAAATNGSCPYSVRYVSANTSSSGVLVEDVLHLTREAPGPGAATQALPAPIVFGCGQVQTGGFLDGAGFDGLMGLGMDKVSVPSLLASNGLVAADSFSMCFSEDGVGRINFGDAGSSDQAQTPFVVRTSTRLVRIGALSLSLSLSLSAATTNETQTIVADSSVILPTYYNVSFTSINVEDKSVAAEFAAVMDSGTSFTYLNDPEYTELATNFNSQISEKRTNFSSGSADPFPFEYCYALGANQTEVLLPDLSLTTKGGALFPVTDPIIVFGDSTGRPVAYCLAILKNDISINIVGQNFMTGLKVVFNREKSVLSWQKFDCYKNARVADAPDGSPSPSPSPSPAVDSNPSPSPAPSGGPTKLTPQQSDASSNNRSPGAAPQPATRGSSNAAACALGGLSLMLPLLLAAALTTVYRHFYFDKRNGTYVRPPAPVTQREAKGMVGVNCENTLETIISSDLPRASRAEAEHGTDRRSRREASPSLPPDPIDRPLPSSSCLQMQRHMP